MKLFKIGAVLNDKWVILEFIGKGAMGEVYRAHQLNLNRDVAIKVISQELLQTLDDDEMMEAALCRFRREVQALAQIRHPNILQIYDYGSGLADLAKDDTFVEFIVMEYIPGATFRYAMPEEGFYPDDDTEQVINWLDKYFLKVLDGVKILHDNGIVHRDIKPENILMDDNIPKIADFGLARSNRWKPVTHSVDSMGTPAYMSPEQFMDFRMAGNQADIYSLGKILYEAVCGKMNQGVIPFRQASINNPEKEFFKELNLVIQKATAEKKEDRFQSVSELYNSLLDLINADKQRKEFNGDKNKTVKSGFYQPKWIWTGVIIAIASIISMSIWHLIGEPGIKQKASEISENAENHTFKTPMFKPYPIQLKPKELLGYDGINMKLINGGDFATDAEAVNSKNSTSKVQSFYIDEFEVTYFNYVEFLNAVKKRLNVENGLVKQNEEIWFYMGDGTKPYEQIIYQHNMFHLRDPQRAANSVVRVTWYGAMAYAEYYGKRLLTENELAYLIKNDWSPLRKIRKKEKTEPVYDNSKNIMQSHNMTSMGNGNESSVETDLSNTPSKLWSAKINSNDTKTPYFSITVDKLTSNGVVIQNESYPWEAFPEVGFRCALSVDSYK
ncbi:MAG: protein kinase [Proteobacteria bacterium]|nr:protein kinase [Pseudomonadota bacterium]